MLSMNGKSPTISTAPPFVPSINSGQALRPSKGERKVFQQNRFLYQVESYYDIHVIRSFLCRTREVRSYELRFSWFKSDALPTPGCN